LPICDGFFYYPNGQIYGSPDELGLDFEPVSLSTRDGLKLDAWFLPAVKDRHGRPTHAGTVLHLHGNAGNMTGHFQHVAWLPPAGWNVLCFDYRGYGRSQGRVSRAGTVLDAHAALDYLLGRPDVDEERIVAFGQSLGGAIGIVLAAERPEIRSLACDGAFDNYRRVASWHIRRNPLLLCSAWWVPRFLMSRDHEPVECIGRISPRPVLIMHGTADQVVPVEMARSLYGAAGEPKEIWLVEGADHYDTLGEHAEEGQARLLRFFKTCLQPAVR